MHTLGAIIYVMYLVFQFYAYGARLLITVSFERTRTYLERKHRPRTKLPDIWAPRGYRNEFTDHRDRKKKEKKEAFRGLRTVITFYIYIHLCNSIIYML
ncbi:hypothetical protein PUN28_013657 [Cardiocondyla obscurior]|uniref:Uncharacterized protein n=1 Tax=Cardiocondyla obscurior TaxID=286306 RepID=A0AAW2F6H5_9HYME